jgi:molybdopterin synthase sulfur carrier subunit
VARLVLLGRLEDLAGAPEIDLPGLTTLQRALSGLPQALRDEVAKGKVRFAHNGEVLAAGTDPAQVSLGEGDELALLPPVSGG